MSRRDGGGLAGQLSHEFVLEGRLAGGDEDGAADGLEEERDGGDGGEIGGADECLIGNHGALEREPRTDADDGLVPDPVGRGGGHVQSVEKATADRGDGAPGDHERDEVASYGDGDAGDDGEERGAEDEREVAHATVAG